MVGFRDGSVERSTKGLDLEGVAKNTPWTRWPVVGVAGVPIYTILEAESRGSLCTE